MAQSNEQGGFGELDKALLGFRGGYAGHSLESIRQLILADRKQHELELLDRLEPLTHEGRGTIAWEMDDMLSAIKAERERLAK